MGTPLQSYFVALATELNIDLQSTKIQPDNARTIKGSFDESVFGSQTEESTSRWMESSSSSDVSLSVPGRRSSIGRCQQQLRGDLRTIKPAYQEPVMDATERWLRELPMEGQPMLMLDESPMSAQRVSSFDDEIRTDSFDDDSDLDDDIPLLKLCRFGSDEIYPVSSLFSLNWVVGLNPHSRLVENDNPLTMVWSEDSREDTSTSPNMQKVASVERSNCKNDTERVKTGSSHDSGKSEKQKGSFAAFEQDQGSSMWIDRKASFE
ncbi:MAG: hypothetical protein SGBAC_006060 [Bacillariaceae sp.]